MKVFAQLEQRSIEWHALRAGVVTASEIDALVTPTWKPRDSKGVQSYLAQKVGERWVGGKLPSFQSPEMEWGIENEEIARKAFERLTKKKVKPVGFILSDDNRTGCSPDGLIGRLSGLEIKCPSAQTHVGYLLDGVVPTAYMPQVQFSLWVTRRRSWWFASWRPGFPMLRLEVLPIPEAFAVFDEVIPEFCKRIDAGFEQLCERNGGAPDRNQFRDELIATEKDVSTGTMNPTEL